MADTTTIRLPPKLRARVRALAEKSGRSAHSFILEAVDQWHFGANKGTEPVKLLVIDMVEKGAVNTVLQK